MSLAPRPATGHNGADGRAAVMSRVAGRGASTTPAPPALVLGGQGMPEPDRKYVRVYYSVVNDERFCDIYHDARHLGTWLQLLLVADAMYPADAPIPAYASRSSVRALVDAGLIEERPHSQYRVHGLASEREMRAQYGRNAAAMRWQSGRNADPMPRRDETRQDETTRAPARERGVMDPDPVKVASVVAEIRQTLAKPVAVPKPGRTKR
jgi:hypothetical protein